MDPSRPRETRNPGPRKTLIALAVLAGASLSGWALDPVREVPPPSYWDHFIVMIWQFKTRVLTDHEKYAALNIHAFHIDRNNPEAAAFSKETKWPFYVDHAADKGYLHLGNQASKLGKGPAGIVVRPNSLADPATMTKMKGFLDTNIPRAKKAFPLAYALDDEISVGKFCSPFEVDGGPQSIAGYRKFLKELYGDNIERLNAQYGTAYQSFDAVDPKPFEAVRGPITAKGLGKLNLSEWCDWRGYMDTQLAETVAELVRHANKLDPDVPSGFVGGQGPAAYGGYDWRKLSKAAQWCEAYDIGGNNEIIRSFWGQGRPLLKTFFARQGAFEQNVWFLWYYLVHGNRGVIAWPDGWFTTDGIAPHIQELADTFKEVQGPVSKLIIDGQFQYDPVAIYYSHPSIQVTWALDAASHGATWVNRSSSMDDRLSTSHLTRMGWSKALEDIGIQPRFYHRDHLLDGQLHKDGVKVLILNRALCLSDEEAQAIRKFAADGGTIIADHMCGIFDEHGKARASGVLDDLFGVRHDLTKGVFTGSTCTEVDAEKGYKSLDADNWEGGRSPQFRDVAAVELGLTEDGGKATGTAGEVPVVVRKGRAVYLNLSTIGYYMKRGTDAAREFTPLLAGLLAESGVKPRLKLEVAGKPSTTTESIVWKNGEKLTLCVISNLKLASSVTGMGEVAGDLGAGKVPLKLTFAEAVKGLKNERTGKALGDGTSFEDEFTPWEANVYTFTP